MKAMVSSDATNVIPFRRVQAPDASPGASDLLGKVATAGYLVLEGCDRQARLLAMTLATFGFLKIGAVGDDGGIVPLSCHDPVRLDGRMWLLARGPLFPVAASGT